MRKRCQLINVDVDVDESINLVSRVKSNLKATSYFVNEMLPVMPNAQIVLKPTFIEKLLIETAGASLAT